MMSFSTLEIFPEIIRKFFDHDLVPVNKEEFGLPQTLVEMAKNNVVRVKKAIIWQPINNTQDIEEAEKNLKKFL